MPNSTDMKHGSPLGACVLQWSHTQLRRSQMCVQSSINLGVQHIRGPSPASSNCSTLQAYVSGSNEWTARNVWPECEPTGNNRHAGYALAQRIGTRAHRSVARPLVCTMATYLQGLNHLQRDGLAHVGRLFAGTLAVVLWAVDGQALAEGALNGPRLRPCICFVQRCIGGLHMLQAVRRYRFVAKSCADGTQSLTPEAIKTHQTAEHFVSRQALVLPC